ncbi:MAG: AraC family transcriptional regulator ligand-binding domain-containing protein [Pseudomarimonas sp.]
MLDPRTIANAYVRTLLGVIETYGVRTEEVLAGTRLDAAALEMPNGRVGAEDLHRIWERGLQLSGDPLLGLKVAEASKPTTYRALGLATMSSASLQAALALMLRYYRLISESSVLNTLTHDDGDVSIIYTAQLLRLQQFPQQVEAILGSIVVLACWLAERPVVPVSVSFRHRPLGALTAYRHCFGCEPQFGATAHVLRIAAKDLARRLPQADADLCRMHCELLDRQLADLPEAGLVTAFAKQWLAAQTSGAIRIHDLARAISMSVRALQRQLQHEGQAWSLLVDSARKHALAELLQQGLSLEQAAQRMGYHDASSLSRAARRWFGKTAGQQRLDSR